MAHARCVLDKQDYTHSEYIILIYFPRQSLLRERASILRYTYIANLAFSKFVASLYLVRFTQNTFLDVLNLFAKLYRPHSPYFRH
jgi:hypothetical protein